MSEPKIISLTKEDVQWLPALRVLLSQLSERPHPIDEALLTDMLASGASQLYLLCSGEEALGMLTLSSYPLLTGRKWWIEDVVVKSECRGRGYGRRLIAHARAAVAEAGGGSLLLTSRPSRVAANELYKSEGFVQRNTNVYKLEVAAPEK